MLISAGVFTGRHYVKQWSPISSVPLPEVLPDVVSRADSRQLYSSEYKDERNNNNEEDRYDKEQEERYFKYEEDRDYFDEEVELKEPGSNGRCALLFFGLARRFKEKAFPSIKKYIIDANPNCEVFAHTYDIGNEDMLSNASTDRNGKFIWTCFQSCF